MSTDVKLSKTQTTKLIQFRVFLGLLLSKLAGLSMTVHVPLGPTTAGISAFWNNNFNNFK